jgi:hypothetical protein
VAPSPQLDEVSAVVIEETGLMVPMAEDGNFAPEPNLRVRRTFLCWDAAKYVL